MKLEEIEFPEGFTFSEHLRYEKWRKERGSILSLAIYSLATACGILALAILSTGEEAPLVLRLAIAFSGVMIAYMSYSTFRRWGRIKLGLYWCKKI